MVIDKSNGPGAARGCRAGRPQCGGFYADGFGDEPRCPHTRRRPSNSNPRESPTRLAAAPNVKLHVAGAGAGTPGVHTLKHSATYGKCSGVAVNMATVHATTDSPVHPALNPTAGVAISGELTRMLNKANETMTVVDRNDGKAPPG